jgi:hypothetical protein
MSEPSAHFSNADAAAAHPDAYRESSTPDDPGAAEQAGVGADAVETPAFVPPDPERAGEADPAEGSTWVDSADTGPPPSTSPAKPQRKRAGGRRRRGNRR